MNELNKIQQFISTGKNHLFRVMVIMFAHFWEIQKDCIWSKSANANALIEGGNGSFNL